jgi:hypothetical protein
MRIFDRLILVIVYFGIFIHCQEADDSASGKYNIILKVYLILNHFLHSLSFC